jgi:hypothetical protein
MSTGEGEDPRDGQARRDGHGERIGIGGGDDSVSRIQLAARWAEAYGGQGDSLGNVLRRFRAAYEYLDAVIHGVEPAELDHLAGDAKPTPTPPPSEFAPPPPGATEQRPWG